MTAGLPDPLPLTPLELAAAIPDTPYWVETRSWLLSGADVFAPRDPDVNGRLVIDRGEPPSGAVVGQPNKALLEEALADVPDDFELIVQLDGLEETEAILPTWRATLAVLHVPEEPVRPGPLPEGVVVSSPPDPTVVSRLPEEGRAWEASCDALAVLFVDGEPVASCQAAMGETLWDVGVDTYDEARRRQGYATTVFNGLASFLAERGLQPVWCAYPDNVASMRLAAKLGFRPIGQIAVLAPPNAPPLDYS